MEQNGTEVRLYSMNAAALGVKAVVVGTPCSADGSDCGVLGGGFRATARVAVSATGDHVAFSWENLHTAPQAFVGALALQKATGGVAVIGAKQISALNAEAAAQKDWPAVTVHKWRSDDGTVRGRHVRGTLTD